MVWASGVWASGVWADNVWFGMGGGGPVVPPVVTAPTVTQAGRSKKKRQLVVIGDDVYDISSREELEAVLESRLEQVKQPTQIVLKKSGGPVVVIPRINPSPIARELALKLYKPGDLELDWSAITRLIDDDEAEIEELVLLH